MVNRTFLGRQSFQVPWDKQVCTCGGGVIIIIIFIYRNWVVTRWQWLCYMYTKHEIGYY